MAVSLLSTYDIVAHPVVTNDTVNAWIDEETLILNKVGRLWEFQPSETDDSMRRDGSSASASNKDAE